MTRLLAIVITGISAANASAHFPFLIPNGPGKGKVVFSDTLKPDDRGVPVDKIAGTKLFILGENKPLSLTLDKAGNFYTFEAPGAGSRVVYGSTDYGVSQRGDSKPMWLRYYPKAVFGSIPKSESATIGQTAPVEITPIVEEGKLRFLILAKGKPLPKTEVTVLAPGVEKSRVVATDASGLTPTFDKPGTYGAYARLVEAKSGEQGGKKYEEIRNYATLVVAFGAK